MPPKKDLQSSDRPRLQKNLDESYSALLVVRSTFARYFKKTDPIMVDIEHTLHRHRAVHERWKKKM
jgi:hypothetical protein